MCVTYLPNATYLHATNLPNVTYLHVALPSCLTYLHATYICITYVTYMHAIYLVMRYLPIMWYLLTCYLLMFKPTNKCVTYLSSATYFPCVPYQLVSGTVADALCWSRVISKKPT